MRREGVVVQIVYWSQRRLCSQEIQISPYKGFTKFEVKTSIYIHELILYIILRLQLKYNENKNYDENFSR